MRRQCGEPDYPVKWCSCVDNKSFWETEGGLKEYIKIGNELRESVVKEHLDNDGICTDCQYCGGLGWVRCAEYDKERVR